MMRRRRGRAGWSVWSTAARATLVVFFILALVVGAVFTAANIVPETRADDVIQAVDKNDLAPSECDGITITNTVSGSGVITGTDGNDWIIGSDGIDTIDGLGGNDCIEGKGGDDVIDGGVNLDLTPGSDVCLGGAGTDTFASCETEIQ